jgi:delta(3,5)-delta(2,4)-dienoyl-CoA isomerase
MWLNLSSIFRRLSHDPNVRAIILTGAGERAFTAGLDVKVFGSVPFTLILSPRANKPFNP